MIERLKNLAVAKYGIEELIELRSDARRLHDEYTSQKLDHPEWLNNSIVMLDSEIKSKVRDERMRRLSDAKARRAQLQTVDEKRSTLDQQIAELEEAIK